MRSLVSILRLGGLRVSLRGGDRFLLMLLFVNLDDSYSLSLLYLGISLSLFIKISFLTSLLESLSPQPGPHSFGNCVSLSVGFTSGSGIL